MRKNQARHIADNNDFVELKMTSGFAFHFTFFAPNFFFPHLQFLLISSHTQSVTLNQTWFLFSCPMTLSNFIRDLPAPKLRGGGAMSARHYVKPKLIKPVRNNGKAEEMFARERMSTLTRSHRVDWNDFTHWHTSVDTGTEQFGSMRACELTVKLWRVTK